ncbi:hypothetical protein OSB04_019059 [Centaurea solstitialis]|uniref:Uncharacterized protein n=1 Tax=Centaurea solstitialis TaxID=347529 RepID=A0AA38WFI2_9ASTR|nr:hypothetical protein OSB04_019059 [Centaurea solstitialis]
MSYDIEQPAITEFCLQITSMLFLSSANSSTSLMLSSSIHLISPASNPTPFEVINDANKRVMGKEFLIIVFASDHFKSYLIGTKVIVHID